MKIYGVGLFFAPNSSRLVWDFIDGPFDTVNPVLLQEAKKQGYSIGMPFESKVIEEPPKAEEPKVIEPEAQPPKKKAGRPAKAKNEPSTTDGPMGAI